MQLSEEVHQWLAAIPEARYLFLPPHPLQSRPPKHFPKPDCDSFQLCPRSPKRYARPLAQHPLIPLLSFSLADLRAALSREAGPAIAWTVQRRAGRSLPPRARRGAHENPALKQE